MILKPMHPDSAGIAVCNVVSERGQRGGGDGQYCTLSPGSRPCLRRFRLMDSWPISSLVNKQGTGNPWYLFSEFQKVKSAA